MFEIELGGKTYKAEVTFYTSYLYEAEFRSDLIKDLFGMQESEDPVSLDGSDKIVSIDFTKTNWIATMKVLWAALKTANPSTPSFANWMKKTSGVNLWLVNEQLGAEVVDCFFHTDVAREEA